MKIRLIKSLILLSLLFHYSLQFTQRHTPKLRCFQCNMPYHCETGLCYGDFCVKTTADGSYVSKGCENISRSVSSDLYAPMQKQQSYCRTEEVLGIETTICYCKDADFCNKSPYYLGIFGLFLSFFFML